MWQLCPTPIFRLIDRLAMLSYSLRCVGWTKLPKAILTTPTRQYDISIRPWRIVMRPNIVFAFADDWGRYASAYPQPARRKHNPRTHRNSQLRQNSNRRRAIPQRACASSKLHAVSKLAAFGQILLADGTGSNSFRRKLGRIHTDLPTGAGRSRLPHRLHIQGLVSRALL